MTEGLREMDLPGFTSKGSNYHKAYYSYPRAIDTLQVGAIKAGQLLVEINSFANPYPFQKWNITSIECPDLNENWKYSELLICTQVYLLSNSSLKRINSVGFPAFLLIKENPLLMQRALKK